MVDAKPRLNWPTWTLSQRNTTTGVLEVFGAVPDPNDPDLFSGWWLRVDVDDNAEPARIIEVVLAQRAPAVTGEPAKLFLSAGDPKVEPVEVTARLLRSVPLGAVHEAVNAHLAGRGEVEGRLSDPTKRGARDDAYYAGWAAHYVRLAGTSSSPVADLAEKFGVTRDRVRNVVHLARQRGLLTRGTHGRAGGELTDKALEALGREGD